MHRLEKILWVADGPVGKSSLADLGPHTVPSPFLLVKRKLVRILLVHRPRNSGCWGRIFPDQGHRSLRLYNYRFFCISKNIIAGGASITLAVAFDDFACGRNEFQFLADIPPRRSEPSMFRRLDRPVFFLEDGWLFFHLQTFEEIIMGCVLLQICFLLIVSSFNREEWVEKFWAR